MEPIPYGRQTLYPEDLAAVERVLRSNYWTQGPEVESFENDFSRVVDASHSVATQSATAALHLAMMGLNLQPGQKVLCPSLSFVATANCIRYCGADVEFVDIDPQTYCIDIHELQSKLETSPKGTYSGVIIVHMAGYPADVESVSNLTREHGLWLVEDACHAPGAQFQNSSGDWCKVGSCQYSEATVFSFHPVKHIASGEGGMLTTRNEDLYSKVSLLRTHGITRDQRLFQKDDKSPWVYEMQTLGFNYRIPDILCALGRSQFQRLSENIERRQQIASIYDHELSEVVRVPFRNEKISHAFHLYIIQTEKRLRLYEFLRERNIYAQVHYIPIHTQPYYEGMYGKQSLPVVEAYYQRTLSLPMFHGLKDKEQKHVIQSVKDFFNEGA